MDSKINTEHICGVRVVDKSYGVHPLYKLEVWLSSKDTKIVHQAEEEVMNSISQDKKHHFKLHWREFPDEGTETDNTSQGNSIDVPATATPAEVAVNQ